MRYFIFSGFSTTSFNILHLSFILSSSFLLFFIFIFQFYFYLFFSEKSTLLRVFFFFFCSYSRCCFRSNLAPEVIFLFGFCFRLWRFFSSALYPMFYSGLTSPPSFIRVMHISRWYLATTYPRYICILSLPEIFHYFHL